MSRGLGYALMLTGLLLAGCSKDAKPPETGTPVIPPGRSKMAPDSNSPVNQSPANPNPTGSPGTP